MLFRPKPTPCRKDMTEGRTELARAKVNLTLHVGASIQSGKWQGYHPLESLVVFADFGDTLSFKPSRNGTIEFEGPFGQALYHQENISIWDALELAKAPPHDTTIDKQIPIAAGLGGGTADAAAVLRAFDPNRKIHPIKIGADGPVCHLSRTAMMEGIGEVVSPLPGLGQISAVLVNPNVAVSTGAVFKAMDSKPRDENPAMTARDGSLLSRALSGTNDMQDFAIAQVPIINDVLRALAQATGCELARMSGSGATCFGIFRSDAQATAAANAISQAQEGWWVRACRLGDDVQDIVT